MGTYKCTKSVKQNTRFLEYFTNYLGILKKKTIKYLILLIISNIKYKNVFQGLDISIHNGGIHRRDVVRLCKPIIYNTLKIREISDKANNKRTINKDGLLRDG